MKRAPLCFFLPGCVLAAALSDLPDFAASPGARVDLSLQAVVQAERERVMDGTPPWIATSTPSHKIASPPTRRVSRLPILPPRDDDYPMPVIAPSSGTDFKLIVSESDVVSIR